MTRPSRALLSLVQLSSAVFSNEVEKVQICSLSTIMLFKFADTKLTALKCKTLVYVIIVVKKVSQILSDIIQRMCVRFQLRTCIEIS